MGEVKMADEAEAQSAAEEYREFRRERKAVGRAEDEGTSHLTKPFHAKWFGRYPQFDDPRRGGAFYCFNDIASMLREKAEKERSAKDE